MKSFWISFGFCASAVHNSSHWKENDPCTVYILLRCNNCVQYASLVSKNPQFQFPTRVIFSAAIFLIYNPVTFSSDPHHLSSLKTLIPRRGDKMRKVLIKICRGSQTKLSGRRQGIHSVIMGGEGRMKGKPPFSLTLADVFSHLSRRE